MIRPLVSHVNGLMVHYAGVRGDLAIVGTHLEVLVKHFRIENLTRIINEPPNNFYSELQCMCLLCRQILVLLLLFLHSAVH